MQYLRMQPASFYLFHGNRWSGELLNSVCFLFFWFVWCLCSALGTFWWDTFKCRKDHFLSEWGVATAPLTTKARGPCDANKMQQKMEVSWNRDTPQIINFHRISHDKPSILGTPIYGNRHLWLCNTVQTPTGKTIMTSGGGPRMQAKRTKGCLA